MTNYILTHPETTQLIAAATVSITLVLMTMWGLLAAMLIDLIGQRFVLSQDDKE